MSASSKIIQAAAGNAAGEGLYVEEVFSTYLYTGNSSTQTITNGIDLDGEGGLVWIKRRDDTRDHILYDTERGTGGFIATNLTAAEENDPDSVTNFNSNGFSLGADGDVNFNSWDFASWTFRKAPKFFDVVTYTGNATSGRTISHNLGSVPGCIIVKKTDNASNWAVYHRGNTASPETDYLRLNTTNATTDDVSIWNDTAPTDSVFTVGNGGEVNSNSATYVAYLFAHNDGDGEFGENADQDIIKCGSYTGGTSGNEINLGFEPQWLLIKPATLGDHWLIFDNMRGLTAGDGDKNLYPNLSNAEAYGGGDLIPTSTGFTLTDTHNSTNGSHTYIYIAIRRGPMKTPESGTEVFAMDQLGQTSPTPPGYNSPFPVDLGIQKGTVASSWTWTTRLLDGGFLKSDSTQAYAVNSQWVTDFQNGYRDTTASSTDYYAWMFRRAPGFFDVVAYEGTGATDRDISHNLGSEPEFIIIKRRDASESWIVYHSGAEGTGSYWSKLELESSGAEFGGTRLWGTGSGEDHTDTTFHVSSHASVNGSGADYIAYLFATLPGVSKVGSYTGNGTSTGDSQVIDCGFSAGARFVLIKRTDLDKDWWVMDTERGIVAGDDALLRLNLANSELSGDIINPNSSGFEVEWRYSATDSANINASGASYIFLAIA